MATDTDNGNALLKAREEIDKIDGAMAELFCRRMEAVGKVAGYKKQNGIPVLDAAREKEIAGRNALSVPEGDIRALYMRFFEGVMNASKQYQSMLNCTGAVFTVGWGERAYDVTVVRGGIRNAGKLFDLARRVLIVTDDGVPESYAKSVADECSAPVIVTLERGEKNKSLEIYGMLCERMLKEGFTRNDCVVAVGGGVIGDLAGFAGATYMRGIDFYNIPTTLLSQVDSSIGGKTGLDFDGIKNILGAFYPPRGVLIDSDLLSTLPQKQLSNGFAEALKMGMTSDEALFRLFEEGTARENIDEVIARSLAVKAAAVALDPDDKSVRRVLNFGHTVGHAIESVTGMLHGECVALGMLPMCGDKVRERLLKALEKSGLPTKPGCDIGRIMNAMRHDKKTVRDGKVFVTTVNMVGSYESAEMPFEQLERRVMEVFGG